MHWDPLLAFAEVLGLCHSLQLPVCRPLPQTVMVSYSSCHCPGTADWAHLLADAGLHHHPNKSIDILFSRKAVHVHIITRMELGPASYRSFEGTGKHPLSS